MGLLYHYTAFWCVLLGHLCTVILHFQLDRTLHINSLRKNNFQIFFFKVIVFSVLVYDAPLTILFVFRHVRYIAKGDYERRHVSPPVYLSVRASVRQHGTTLLPLNGFS